MVTENWVTKYWGTEHWAPAMCTNLSYGRIEPPLFALGQGEITCGEAMSLTDDGHVASAEAAAVRLGRGMVITSVEDCLLARYILEAGHAAGDSWVCDEEVVERFIKYRTNSLSRSPNTYGELESAAPYIRDYLRIPGVPKWRVNFLGSFLPSINDETTVGAFGGGASFDLPGLLYMDELRKFGLGLGLATSLPVFIDGRINFYSRIFRSDDNDFSLALDTSVAIGYGFPGPTATASTGIFARYLAFSAGIYGSCMFDMDDGNVYCGPTVTLGVAGPW